MQCGEERDVSKESDFEAFMSAHRGQLLRYALRRLDSNESVEDAVAETYSVAWRRWNDRPSSSEELYWVYGIARLVISNLTRGQRRRFRLRARLEMMRESEPTDSSWPSSQDKQRVLEAIQALPELDREALRLAYWERLSYREIGQVLGCSENAVDVRLRRARKSIGVLMERATLSFDQHAPSKAVDR
jgi:RNA polymerase sigma-70 factor (ECF subfamily)